MEVVECLLDPILLLPPVGVGVGGSGRWVVMAMPCVTLHVLKYLALIGGSDVGVNACKWRRVSE